MQRETGLLLLAGAVVVLFCASLLFLDRGFFWTDDYQTYQLAGYCDLARSWSEGEFPLLSPSSWRGGALAGEYQVGVFSFFLTGLALIVFGLKLPLPLAAATFSIVHLVVLAAGVVRLARRRGLSADLALLAALVTSLSGWIFIWGATSWFPALASFAWVPWVWWGLERSSESQRGWARFLPAAVFIYLVVTAGWPFSVLMISLLSLWLAVRTVGERRSPLSLWPMLAAWTVGLGLSAPAWLMLLEYIPSTFRGQTPALKLSFAWSVPPYAWPALVFPSFLMRWQVFSYWKEHMPVELTGGLVPVVILAALLRFRGWNGVRALGWEGLLAVLLMILCMAPGLGNFQYGFRWLPFFFLVLALLAARSLALLRSKGHYPGRICFYLLLPIWAGATLLGSGPLWVVLSTGTALLALSLFWSWGESHAQAARLRPWLPCAVTVVSCWLSYAAFTPFYEVPTWFFGEGIRRQEPLDRARRYLSAYSFQDIMQATDNSLDHRFRGTGMALYPGNSAMYSGLDFVGGYSPMMPAGLQELFDYDSAHGGLTNAGAERLFTKDAGPHGLLELFGVDGLVVAQRFVYLEPILTAQGWQRVGQVEGGLVFHRGGAPSPRVRALTKAEVLVEHDRVRQRLLEDREGQILLILHGAAAADKLGVRSFAPAQVTVLQETRNSVTVEVTTTDDSQDSLLVFSRPWYPGYRADCAGQSLPVEVLDLALPAVRLPGGMTGRVRLEYRPRSLVWGEYVSALTVIAFVLLLVVEVGRRRRSSARQPCLSYHRSPVAPVYAELSR